MSTSKLKNAFCWNINFYKEIKKNIFYWNFIVYKGIKKVYIETFLQAGQKKFILLKNVYKEIFNESNIK